MAYTPQELSEAIAKAKRGDRLHYWRGNLQYDRGLNRAIDGIAQAAQRASDNGDVALVQKRLGPGSCDYFAIKT